MPIIYWWPQDEDHAIGQPQTTFFTDNGDWWISELRAGVVHALAYGTIYSAQTAIASARTALWQDDPAGTLTATVDEYFWQPLITVQPSGAYAVPLPWAADEQTPALFGQPDEDFWADPRIQRSTVYALQPSWATDEQPTTAAAQPLDEDFWAYYSIQGSTAYFALSSWIFDEQVPAGSLFTTIDEDFWINPVSRQNTANQPFYFFDSAELPQTTAAFTPDEDYWTAPIQQSTANCQSYIFSSDEVPQSTVFLPEEDYWQPLRFSQTIALQPLAFDPVEIASVPGVFAPDEDYWFTQVRPFWLAPYQRLAYLPDTEDVPALSAPVPPNQIPGPFFIRRHGRAEGLYLPGRTWR